MTSYEWLSKVRLIIIWGVPVVPNIKAKIKSLEKLKSFHESFYESFYLNGGQLRFSNRGFFERGSIKVLYAL